MVCKKDCVSRLLTLKTSQIRNVLKFHLISTLKCIYIKFEFNAKKQPNSVLFNPSRSNRIPKFSKLNNAFTANKQSKKN